MRVLIVLGKRLLKGGAPAPAMLDRIAIAEEVCRFLKPDRILLSGGRSNPTSEKTEAAVMADLLTERGIPKEMLVFEELSHSTIGNTLRILSVLEELHADDVILVTSLDHLSRALMNPVTMLRKKLQARGIGFSVYSSDHSGIDMKFSRYL